MRTHLEQLALIAAVADSLSEVSSDQECLDAYSALCDAAEKNEGIPSEVTAWHPYQDESASGLLNIIDDKADQITLNFKRVLELAKKGLIKTAIDGTQPSDQNELDMIHLVELGSTIR